MRLGPVPCFLHPRSFGVTRISGLADEALRSLHRAFGGVRNLLWDASQSDVASEQPDSAGLTEARRLANHLVKFRGVIGCQARELRGIVSRDDLPISSFLLSLDSFGFLVPSSPAKVE
jgi:hypothetical protein